MDDIGIESANPYFGKICAELTAKVAKPQPKLNPEGENSPLEKVLVSRVFEKFYERASGSILGFSKMPGGKALTAFSFPVLGSDYVGFGFRG